MSESGKKRHRSKKGKEGEDQVRKDNLPEVQKRFNYLFEIYDHEGLGTIAAEDFPNFVRALGLCPTNAKMDELAKMCIENEGDNFFVNSRMENLLTPIVLDVILNPNHEMAPPSDELLALALKCLDQEHKGHLTEGDFRVLMAGNAEKLDPDEIEDAVDEAVDVKTGVVDFDKYAGRMLYNSKLSYVPRKQAEEPPEAETPNQPKEEPSEPPQAVQPQEESPQEPVQETPNEVPQESAEPTQETPQNEEDLIEESQEEKKEEPEQEHTEDEPQPEQQEVEHDVTPKEINPGDTVTPDSPHEFANLTEPKE